MNARKTAQAIAELSMLGAMAAHQDIYDAIAYFDVIHALARAVDYSHTVHTNYAQSQCQRALTIAKRLGPPAVHLVRDALS